MFDLIAFDADDTLWHNEALYGQVQVRYKEILAAYGISEDIDARLLETETDNIPLFGYGAKSFALSMIEAAVRMTGGRLSAGDTLQIVEAVKGMLRQEVALLDHALEAISQVGRSYRLMLITKGDLLDQQSKLARSGLAVHFDHVEIVSHKTVETYGRLLERYGVTPQRFLMVGNSLRSDVLPVLALGARAVYIPHELTWAHEHVDREPQEAGGFYQLEDIGQLPGFLATLARETAQ